MAESIPFDIIALDEASADIARLIERIQQFPDVKHIEIQGEGD